MAREGMKHRDGGQRPEMSGYSVYEEENDRLTENLRQKANALKSLSIDIGTEVKYHNKMLTDMDSDFDSTGGFLGATIGRLKVLSRGSQAKLLCYMFLFSLFVFFVIYWFIKLRTECIKGQHNISDTCSALGIQLKLLWAKMTFRIEIESVVAK